MLRSIAELAAYGALAALLTAASLSPHPASSAATGNTMPTNSTPNLEQPLTATTERGALLFAVKGCIGCHTHTAFPNARMQVGPDLTDLAARAGSRVVGLDAAGYVRQSLREPGAYRATSGGYALMPDLGLSDEQVESLTAFLLSSAR